MQHIQYRIGFQESRATIAKVETLPINRVYASLIQSQCKSSSTASYKQGKIWRLLSPEFFLVWSVIFGPITKGNTAKPQVSRKILWSIEFCPFFFRKHPTILYSTILPRERIIMLL